ncbi:MAG: ribose-5-phosphate isomerase [Promicromonosporaceae bacterium]|nr:ribose-5-phosphate isomerase [Promicromonosporaceae bacterium]
MRIHIATDHAGFELKNHFVEVLGQAGHDVIDHGAHEYDADDDYPAFCISAAEAVARAWQAGQPDSPDTLGIVIGGSGNGEQLAANRVPGVRAILAWSVETAQLGRQHNNANVVAVGGRMHSLADATAIIEAFLATPFSGEPRHARRVQQMLDYEAARPAGSGENLWLDAPN